MQPIKQNANLFRQWAFFLVAGAAALLGGFLFADEWWSGGQEARWLALALTAHLYFAIVLFRNLSENHRPGEAELLPTLGLANALTLLRAVLMAAVFGFLFSPRPEGVYSWLPGVLYTLASLPDFVDGIIARKTNHVTGLGEILDMNVDSVGVFTATYLSFQYGVIPWWYLPIGLARYIFVAGIAVRERLGLPVHDLPFSFRRRGFAALKMGFMFVILFPLFRPPGTHVAAAAFGLPFLVGFLWDWGLVAGWLDQDSWQEHRVWKRRFLQAAPWALRVLAVVLILPDLVAHYADPSLQVLSAAETVVTLFLALGIAPRTTAIVAVCLVGVNQNLAPLEIQQYLLIFVYIWIIFLGSGPLSLWPVEEQLVNRRIGDPA